MNSRHVVTKKEFTLVKMFKFSMQGKVCSLKEMKKNLQERTNLPTQNRFVSCLVRQGILIKESKGMYKVTDEPIHIKKLQKAYDEHSAINLLKQNGYRIYKSIVKYEEV